VPEPGTLEAALSFPCHADRSRHPGRPRRPIDLPEGPVGTLNVYAARPHRWDEADVAAIQAYTRVIASLLRAAARAHVSGKAATQLQHALDSRSLIEQAKGVLMERRGLDQQAAFDLLRSRARSTRRRLDEVARQVVGRG
jgi:hypothetical protein